MQSILYLTDKRITKNYTTMDKKLTKSKDKKLGGVCAGIAEYFGWDPTWVRLGYALLTICSIGFPGLLVYLVFWLIMPEPEA